MKGRVEQDFHGNFRVNVTCLFFWPFSPDSLTESCFERSPRPSQVSRKEVFSR